MSALPRTGQGEAMRPRVLSLVGWMSVGLLVTVGFISRLVVIFLPCVAVAVVLIVVLLRAGLGLAGVAGLLSSLAVVCAFIAWTNRGGPGDVCTGPDLSDQSCISEFDPRPWLVATVVLLLLAVLSQLRFPSRVRTHV